MRISTSAIYDTGVARLSDAQSNLLKTQQQIAASRRILTPADDPVGAARVLDLTQGQSMNTQFAANRTAAKNALGFEEGTLQNVTTLMQDLKSAVVAAGNGTYDDSQRKVVANDLRSRMDELIALANTRDGTGNYIFAGFQIGTQPFTKTATGAQYAGDQGQTTLQVDSARQMALGDSGSGIFESVDASITFKARLPAANTGTATISTPLKVIDATLLTGHNYDVVFSGGGTSYSVYDLTLDPTKTGTPLAAGAYTTPQLIAFDGLQMTIAGAPANNDLVTVRPTGKQSVFTTMNDLIELLETPVATNVIAKANLTYGLGAANANIDNALDSVLTTRTSIGSRLKELDSLDSNGDNKDILYESSISQIQDLDYNEALSNLAKQQTILEAAQKSFVKVSSLSLFSLL